MDHDQTLSVSQLLFLSSQNSIRCSVSDAQWHRAEKFLFLGHVVLSWLRQQGESMPKVSPFFFHVGLNRKNVFNCALCKYFQTIQKKTWWTYFAVRWARGRGWHWCCSSQQWMMKLKFMGWQQQIVVLERVKTKSDFKLNSLISWWMEKDALAFAYYSKLQLT